MPQCTSGTGRTHGARASPSMPPGLLHHSDRGSQYTAQDHRHPACCGIIVSMSRKADCYDNALMESFIGTLKSECVERESYQTREEARQSIFEYLEGFYNRQRLHSSLGMSALSCMSNKSSEFPHSTAPPKRVKRSAFSSSSITSATSNPTTISGPPILRRWIANASSKEPCGGWRD